MAAPGKDTRDLLTKGLAVVGTLLVWFPILATIAISIAGFFRRGFFNVDYLMPAELFPAVLIGGGLLLWAAIRSRIHQKLIGWSLAAAVVVLFGGQALAVAVGLASGEAEPVGWNLALLIVWLVAYTLLVILTGIAGMLQVRDLFGEGK